ncbi:MAG: hypothetical protein HYZ72_15605 [Deltaproteobacteria bacterium]|nr:hypothetical protein [Deltaproteobacteria bacterium]
MARRFAQPLGIHLDQWEGRIIATEKGIVRLLPVAERAKQLFGEDGAAAVADRIEARPTGPVQMTLFVEEAALKTIDLGAGHVSASENLCGRVVTALKSQALLNEAPGAGYLERRWPPAFKESGAWPLASLRQAFLTGAMERLVDPDAYLRRKIPEFVLRSDFGLASGQQAGGGYSRVWFSEMLPAEEVAFDADVHLLTKTKAKALKAKEAEPPVVVAPPNSTTEIPAPLLP